MGYGKAVEKVASTVGRVSDNRVRRNKIKDAGRASQRKLNERDQDKSFYYAGWRPLIGWVCAAILISHFFVFPIIHSFYELNEPQFDIEVIMGMLSTLLGVSVISRSYDKRNKTETNFTKRLFRRS